MFQNRFFSSLTKTKIPGFVFDIDGVLVQGSKAIPEARNALRFLNNNKIPFVFLTNSGGLLEREKTAQVLTKLGMLDEIPNVRTVLSHTPYKAYKEQYKTVFAVGPIGCSRVLKQYGFKNVYEAGDLIGEYPGIAPFNMITHRAEKYLSQNGRIPKDKLQFDAVMVLSDPRDWSADLQIVADILTSDNGKLGTTNYTKNAKSIPIFWSQRDFQWKTEYSLPRFALGAFREILYKVVSIIKSPKLVTLPNEMTNSDTKLVHDKASQEYSVKKFINERVMGKPERIAYEFAEKELRAEFKDLYASGEEFELGDVYMVGDNPLSDIIGAKNYGWKTCLVKTGVYNDEYDLQVEPSMIVENVEEAVNKGVNQSSRLSKIM
ncbi:hypothetical protein ACO0R3_002016 [Hanseniaspora guilliermondii]